MRAALVIGCLLATALPHGGGAVRKGADRAQGGATRPLRRRAPVRVQRINLDAFGWRHRPIAGPGEGVWTPWTELAVDSRGRVLVGFTVPGPVRLAKRNHPNMRFRVLRFGSSDRPDLSLSIPTRRWQNGVYVDDHDDIIVHANGRLQALVALTWSPKTGP